MGSLKNAKGKTVAVTTNANSTVVTFGDVKANGTPDISKVVHQLPVPACSMTIKQKIRKDKSEIRGKSGLSKQATGYECTEVNIALTLLDDEDVRNGIRCFYSALDKLAELQLIFRDRMQPSGDGKSSKNPQHGVPRIYSIQSTETDAVGIKTVMLEDLDYNFVGNGKTDIEVSLHLVEWDPPARQAEKRKSQPTTTNAIASDPYWDDPYAEASSAAADAETGKESAFSKGRRAAKDMAAGT